MAVTFITGRAGAGKTHRCVDAITRDCGAQPLGPPIIYLVPEQASYQAERALLSTGRIAGYTRAQVLSFTRLADYVFAQAPAPRAPRLGANHRALLVALLVARKRREQPQSLVGTLGMEDALNDFIGEARQQSLSPDKIRATADLAARSPGLAGREAYLREKLHTLADLVEEFERSVGSRFEDPHDTLMKLSDAIATGDLLQGAQVYVDGFIGYTPVEEMLLAALARRCRDLIITIPGDPDRVHHIVHGMTLRRHFIFRPVEETLERLLRVFRSHEIPIAKVEECYAAPGENRFVSPVLAHLEKHFLSRKKEPTTAAEDVVFHECAGAREEARLAVEIIAQWMRDHGWQPGDCGIMARDLEGYAEPLTEALNTLRLPFFIDRSKPLETHPIVVGLQSLIRAALYPQRTNHLLDLAKSGFLPVPRTQVDRLENHVLQYPRSTSDWFSREPWAPPPARSAYGDGEEEFAQIPYATDVDFTRRAVVTEIELFRAQYMRQNRTEGPLHAFVEALCGTIERNVVYTELAEEDRRILDRIGELLNEEVEAAGEDPVSWELAGDLTIRALAALALPRIPPLVNQVFVGQVDRSRQPALKGVVLLGMSEGLFPRPGKNTSLLNDSERDLLEELGLDVRPSARRQFEREALFAYRAVTAPSERLALLRPNVSGDGSALAPSPFWIDLRESLPDAQPAPCQEELHPLRCWRPRELIAAAVRCIDQAHLAAPREVTSRPYLELRTELAFRDESKAVFASAAWSNAAALSQNVVEEFYKKKLRLSPSQLESFARCPFQHFVRFMLRPAEILRPEFESRDAGNFAHAVLQNFTRILREERNFAPPSAEEFETLFEQALQTPLGRLSRTRLLDSAGGALLREKLTHFLRELCRWMVGAFGQLPLKPQEEEVKLAAEGESIFPPDTLPPGWNVTLRGRIDRLDHIMFDGGKYAVIVDYKLRKKTFDYDRWMESENLQLPFYLLAAHEMKGAVAGGLYLEIIPKVEDEVIREPQYTGVVRSSMVRALFPDSPWKSIPAMQGSAGDPDEMPRGWGTPINDNEFEELLEATKRKIAEMVNGIAGGSITVSPSRFGTATACGSCGYQPLCQVDYSVNSARRKVCRGRVAVLSHLREVADGREVHQ